MASKHDDDNQGRLLTLILGLAGLVVALVIGVAMRQSNRPAQPVDPTAAPARPARSLPLPTPITASSPDPEEGGVSVIVQNGVVKFYFAPNQSALAVGGRDALTQIVKAVADGKKAVVSGFHDSTGDAARNAQLARQRALAVRQALNALGVSNAQIELKVPEAMQTSGSDAEARRVEITAQ